MSRPRVYENPVCVSVVMEADVLAHIQKQAARMTISEGKTVCTSTAIKRAILTVYPLPTQEMFKF